jgi:glycosyltransferase involved in cell wall biosynthesis
LNETARGLPRLAVLTNILAPYRVPLFQGLAESFEVTVLTSGEEGNREQWAAVEEQAQGFRIKRSWGFTFRWTNRDQGSVLDIKHLHINPGLLLDLLRIRPDVIITVEMGFRTLVALAYGGLFRRPVWVWWGGTLHTERGIGRTKRVFRSWLVGRVKRWFSYGVTSTEYLTSLGVPREHVVELQNCIPEKLYVETTPPSAVLEIRPVVLCVGQLIPRKGVDLLLDAVARLQAEKLKFSVLIVGAGPEKARLEEKTKQLGLVNVHFYAPQNPELMPAVYRSADVLVFPTREDVWGLVVNEALWSGLPALVSIYAGCYKEVVPPSSTFDPLDSADFKNALRRAVCGQLPPADRTRLKGMDEVTRIVAVELRINVRVRR